MNDFTSQKLPRRISGIHELAFDMQWSWRHEARKLFKALDRPLWKTCGHNPVKLLNRIAPHRLVSAADDTEFLQGYDDIYSDFKNRYSAARSGCQIKYPFLNGQTVAYFSMEFAIHSSLPLYAGGLGVLAGDYCKEASDLGISMVAIGFMYPQGYFEQNISEEGWQQEIYRQLDFSDSPISPVLDAQQKPLKVKVELDSRPVYLAVWQVNVGSVKLYLLDTRLEENSPSDRELSARLYGGNSETRIQQEIILGIGGVRVLRALQINPSIWHANEGHTSFMMLERCRELVKNGLDFTEAWPKVQAATVFTTHTPVPAGNDAFSFSLMEKYFAGYWGSLGLNQNEFLWLGTNPPESNAFNMTVLGFKMASQRNGVSKLHGAVCRRMWNGLWPETEEKNVPIGSVTNGVHVPSWIAPQMAQLFEKYIGSDWLDHHDEPARWEKIVSIPDEELWRVHCWLKSKLVNEIQERAQNA